jgi:hypothetical protein
MQSNAIRANRIKRMTNKWLLQCSVVLDLGVDRVAVVNTESEMEDEVVAYPMNE